MNRAISTFLTNGLSAVILAVLLFSTGSQANAQCVLICNNLIQVSLDPNCEAEMLPDDILEGGGCPNGNLQVQAKINNVWTPAVGNFVATAANINQTIQVRVRDLNTGNYCTGYIHVEDKIAPLLICSDVFLNCAVTNYTPAYLLEELGIDHAYPVVEENCGTYTLSHIDTWTNLNCNETFNGISDLSGYITRKWTAVDGSGNTSTCNQYLYFDRRHTFDLVMPADVTVSCEDPTTNPSFTGVPHINEFGVEWPIWPNVGFCELTGTYKDQVLRTCDGTYKILRTWTILDWCLPNGGVNPLIYVQIIKVMDSQGPLIECPADMTVGTNPNDCHLNFDLPDIIVEDACSRLASIEAQWDDYNGIGHSIFGSFSSFPGNNLWAPDTLAVLGYANNLGTGNNLIRYIVTDDCGNTTVCEFNVFVQDDVPPVSVCDQTTTIALGPDDPFDCYLPGANGCDFAGVTWVPAKNFDDGSYDECNGVKFTVRRMPPYSDCINSLNPINGHPDCNDQINDSPSEFERAIAEGDSIKFYCCEVGTTQTVILRVYQIDVNGNYTIGWDGEPIYNECMIQVEVQDKLKPTCTPPPSVTVSCTNFDPSLWLYGKAIPTDNCCLDSTYKYQGQKGLAHSVSYTQFDTVCNKGTINRTFRAYDCHGQSSQCTQRIVVNYNQDYFVKFPNDAIVTVCDGTGNYGEPSFFGKDCELLGVTYADDIFTVVPDACFKIERTWKIINWCTYNANLPCINVPNPNPAAISNAPANLPGPTVSRCGTLAPWAPTVVKINPTDPVATNYCTFWDANANCYIYKQIIKIIDGVAPTVVGGCPPSPVTICDITANNSQLWNEMYWWDNANQSHDLCEAPSDICITATDACSGANINIEYQLFLDLDGDGSMETIINSINTGIAGLGWNAVPFGNANGGSGTIRQFDERAVNANQKYGFAIQETVNGVNRTACVRFNTQQAQSTFVPAELPYGRHKIKWFISDGCGNEAVCEYNIIIKDCKAPTVVCHHGLSVNIMPGGMIAMWDTDFLKYTEDNCTKAQYIKTAIRKCGQGTGFPVDANGQPVKSITFTCDELGEQCVELWAIDLAGNADYCQTYIDVQDNIGSCGGNAHPTVSGSLKTELHDGVEEAAVNLVGTPSNGMPQVVTYDMSDNGGLFWFINTLPLGSNYTITPKKDDNPLNGITTYDLVLISKHILGVEPLGSPYRMIAADANKSNSLTTFDIVELRKLILGIYQDLPNNESWRFIPSSYTFPNEQNPFQNPFPENISVAEMLASEFDADFMGIKIGDVNNSAVSNSLVTSEDRSNGTLLLDVEDRDLKAGETFEVTFKTAQEALAYQFTLNLNGLEATGVVADDKVSANNFGFFANKGQDAAVTVSLEEAAAFTLKFRAEKAGKLSEMLTISNRITKAEAYAMRTANFAASNERMDVALRFNSQNGSVIAGAGFELLQNVPNPVNGSTSISFNLPAATDATLSITNAEGRVLKTLQGSFEKGFNTVTIQRAELEAGILFYQLSTTEFSATKKMIVVD